MTTSGIQAGFLWELDRTQSAIYIKCNYGNCSPFQNPKFAEAFKKADHIVLECIPSEISPKLDGLVQDLAVQTQQFLSDRKIESLNEKIISELKTPWPELEPHSSNNPREKFIFILYYLFCEHLIPNRFLCEEISQAAKEKNKKIETLFSHEEAENNLKAYLKSFFNDKMFYLIIEFFLCDAITLETLRNSFFRRGIAGDLGDLQGFRFDIDLDDEDKQAIIRKKFTKYKDELLSSFDEFTQTISTHDSLKAQKIQKRSTICRLGAQERTLFFCDTVEPDTLLLELSKIGLRVLGPIKEEINPRGFLWEVSKGNQVVAYLNGSVHLTPKWILEHINSATWSAFQKCNALGVEVDITRQDAKEAMGEVETEKLVDELIEQLPISFLKAVVEGGLEQFNLTIEQENERLFVREGFLVIFAVIQKRLGEESGIDLLFIQKAKERRIAIKDLESLETHREFADNFSLLSSPELRGREIDPTQVSAHQFFSTLVKYYEQHILKVFPEVIEIGNVNHLDLLFAKESKECQEAMNARNMEMALSIHKMIVQKLMPFGVAGALHYAGPMAIHKLLVPMGYSVRQVFCEEPRRKTL